MLARVLTPILAIGSLLFASQAFGLGADLGKEQLAEYGPHAVHGFFVNETDVVFFAADTKALNEYLAALAQKSDEKPTVVLHEGDLVAKSPWAKGEGKAADWKLTLKVDKSAPPQVDVWLGRQIDRTKIALPEGVEASVAEDSERP